MSDKFFIYLKNECIKENIDVLTVYKVIQIIKDYFKER